MDEKNLNDLFSSLLPDGPERDPTAGEKNALEQPGVLLQSLKTAAVITGGDVEKEISQFIGGKGTLLETTRAAVAKGGSATTQVADFLKRTFNLPAGTARLIASLLVKLFPAVGGLTGKQTAKSKPRRKKKTAATSAKKKKTASSKKPSTAGTAKKPKKAVTKKTSSKPKTASSSASKKATRAATISLGEAPPANK